MKPHPRRCTSPEELMPILLLGLILFSPADDDDPTDVLLGPIRSVVGGNTAASPAARAAWDQLVARGPAALPGVLRAMDTSDPVVKNWLRTAFDRVVDD